MVFSLGDFNPDRDLQLYTEQVRQHPDFSDAHYRLGETFRRNGHYKEAIEEFKKAIDLKPDSFITYKSLAYIFYVMESYSDAIPLFKKAIEYKPDYIEAYYDLGGSYKWLHRYEEAISVFQAVTKVRSDLDVFDVAYINLSGCYEKAGRIEESLEARKRVVAVEREILTVDPDEALLLGYLGFHLGTDLEKLGRYKEALEAYQAVVATQPYAFEWFSCYIKVPLMYEKIGQYQESKKLYDKIIGQFTSRVYMLGKNSIDAANPYYGLGIVYEQQGKYLDALRAFKEAYRLKPRWDEPKNAIDRVELKMKKEQGK